MRAILKKSRWQHPTKYQLYGHQPPITKIIKIRRTRHARHCWRSRDELISDVLLWTPLHGRAKAGRPAWSYIQQLCADTGCSLEDMPEAMNNREVWRDRVRNIRADSATWWWWWWWFSKKFCLWLKRSFLLDLNPDLKYPNQLTEKTFTNCWENETVCDKPSEVSVCWWLSEGLSIFTNPSAPAQDQFISGV